MQHFLGSYISPCPVAWQVVHIQDLLHRHQVSGDDGKKIRVGIFLIAVKFREHCKNETQDFTLSQLTKVKDDKLLWIQSLVILHAYVLLMKALCVSRNTLVHEISALLCH